MDFVPQQLRMMINYGMMKYPSIIQHNPDCNPQQLRMMINYDINDDINYDVSIMMFFFKHIHLGSEKTMEFW